MNAIAAIASTATKGGKFDGKHHPLDDKPLMVQQHTLRVLIVESKESNRLVFEAAARGVGYQTEWVGSARHAHRMLLDAAIKGEPYSLLVTDFGAGASEANLDSLAVVHTDYLRSRFKLKNPDVRNHDHVVKILKAAAIAQKAKSGNGIAVALTQDELPFTGVDLVGLARKHALVSKIIMITGFKVPNGTKKKCDFFIRKEPGTTIDVLATLSLLEGIRQEILRPQVQA